MVSAIIPARNEEATIARSVESLAAQPEVDEILVVNDQSTDGTGEILEQLSRLIPRLRVLTTGELPSGWIGKNYAASIGAAAAAGDWLLFTDADTYHLPGSTRRALEDAREHCAALVSYSPEQELGSFWERALIPFVYCRLAAKYSFARINDPARVDAAVNGQFLLLRRDAYDAIGGHSAVAGEILEDVAIAGRVKRAGFWIYFAASSGVVRTRMYQGFRAMWQGWTKNLYSLMAGTPRAFVLELAEATPCGEAAFIALFWYFLLRKQEDAVWLLLFFVLAVVLWRSFRYAIELYRNLYPVSFIQYYVPAMALYVCALTASAWKHAWGSIVWKGREYPASARHGSA